jgi:acetyl-CoA carboxylase carboxyltransferase component
MDWQSELDELHKRENLARLMGGPDKIKRQHDGGRLTVRERIEGLLDNGSFHEVGAITGNAVYDDNGEMTDFTPANCVMGRGMIDGRPVVVSGDDFTIRGGSADATIREKTLMAEQMANQYRLPIIRIIEGSGGGGSIRTIELMGRSNVPGSVGKILNYHYTTDNLAVVPVVGLGLGSVAGLGAARLTASHYSIMTKSTSAVFIVGPTPSCQPRATSEPIRTRGLGDSDKKRRCRSRCRDRGRSLRMRP